MWIFLNVILSIDYGANKLRNTLAADKRKAMIHSRSVIHFTATL